VTRPAAPAPRPGRRRPALAVCADVGSTFTKVVVVDLADGALVASAAHPTTVDTDVLHGLDAAIAAAAAQLDPGTDLSTVYACSSAGGGLRLAVVGYEKLVTAEAGHRVGLSAGARVVHVAAGPLDGTGMAALRAARPDVVLLVGGTDGGDAEVLTHNATRLAAARLRVPVVLAGNVAARDTARQALAAKGVPVIEAENVLPRIGVLNPRPARLAIREVFLRHVIGGKKLSKGPRFASLVRGATPDLVLAGVELLADHTPGDLLVVDVGGATTDVYSALATQEDADAEVAGALWRSRTVEGDLGMRWSAPGVVAAAAAERLLAPGEEPALTAAAAARAADTGFLATSAEEREVDQRLATLAATVALRRHAGRERRGKDLQGVRLVVGSGGVLRHAEPGAPLAVLDAVVHDHAGGWPLPRRPRVVVDVHNVLAAAGLLAVAHPAAAVGLLRRHLCAV
jgi:uncharacterized protein (TIGR01319 family)